MTWATVLTTLAGRELAVHRSRGEPEQVVVVARHGGTTAVVRVEDATADEVQNLLMRLAGLAAGDAVPAEDDAWVTIPTVEAVDVVFHPACDREALVVVIRASDPHGSGRWEFAPEADAAQHLRDLLGVLHGITGTRA